MFQTLAPTKNAVLMPYLTVNFSRFYFKFISEGVRAFLSSNNSFIISEGKFVLTLKISVTSF